MLRSTFQPPTLDSVNLILLRLYTIASSLRALTHRINTYPSIDSLHLHPASQSTKTIPCAANLESRLRLSCSAEEERDVVLAYEVLLAEAATREKKLEGYLEAVLAEMRAVLEVEGMAGVVARSALGMGGEMLGRMQDVERVITIGRERMWEVDGANGTGRMLELDGGREGREGVKRKVEGHEHGGMATKRRALEVAVETAKALFASGLQHSQWACGDD